MNGFFYTLAVLIIFTLGAMFGILAHKDLNDYINKEVANRFDDIKTLQQAGYIQEPFYVDTPVMGE